MKHLKIALLAGGDSSERAVSLDSAAQIAKALDRTKYEVTLIDIQGRDWHHTDAGGNEWQVDKNDFSLTIGGVGTSACTSGTVGSNGSVTSRNTTDLKCSNAPQGSTVTEGPLAERRTFDYALIMIHGTPGEDGRLQGYLDMMGIPYSSCSLSSSVITFDKITTKRAVAGLGIDLAREVFIRRGEAIDAGAIIAKLGLPLFVKPNASGSSFGVTKVRTEEELSPAIEAAFTESDAVLIEECITGREMGCGMLVASGREYLFPITEIVSKNDFFDYEAKYTVGRSEEITPADIAPEIAAELNRRTRIAYHACRCSGVVRVDFIVTSDNRAYLIEVNSIPGMSAGSIVPKQVAAMGMSVGELYDLIITDTCHR